MDHKLAKQLKDNGFKQPKWYKDSPEYNGFYWTNSWISNTEKKNIKGKIPTGDVCAYSPTLEELIEACGKFRKVSGEEDYLFYLEVNNLNTKEWRAGYQDSSYGESSNISEEGKTPTEAVAKLWLKLQG